MLDEFGTVTAPRTVRIARSLPGPIERVWAFLTEPDKRGLWLAAGPMELRQGGSVRLDFLHANLSAEREPPEKFKQLAGGVSQLGHVTRLDPPHLLAYTWNEKDGRDPSEVTFKLTEQGDRVLLEVTHERLPGHIGVVHTVFPHVSVAGGRGLPTLVSQLLPGPGPERSRTVQIHLVPEPLESDAARQAMDGAVEFLLRVVRDEDYATGLGIQSALPGGAIGRVSAIGSGIGRPPWRPRRWRPPQGDCERLIIRPTAGRAERRSPRADRCRARRSHR